MKLNMTIVCGLKIVSSFVQEKAIKI